MLQLLSRKTSPTAHAHIPTLLLSDPPEQRLTHMIAVVIIRVYALLVASLAAFRLDLAVLVSQRRDPPASKVWA